jgi:beta-lactamase class A
MDKLQAELDAFFDGFNADSAFAVYVEDLSTGESTYCVLPNQDGEPKISASLIKLYIAGAVFEAVKDGKFELDEDVETKLETMIRDSNNESTNVLIALLGDGDAAAGMTEVNEWADSIECTVTKLGRLMGDYSTDEENYTTVQDCAAVLRLIYEKDFVSEEFSEKMLEWLSADGTSGSKGEKLRRGISDAGSQVANKTGELSIEYGRVNIENDVGIVFSPGGDYIICVLSQPVSSANARSEIANISKLTYEFFNR